MDREINTQSGLDRRESFQRTEILDNSPGTELEPKVYHPLSLPLLALLAPASILGLLARLGLVALATYDGQSIFALAYVQAVGCLIMGFGLGMKEPLEKFPLYIALTTGFCGSLTTFSGWQLDVFTSWTNPSHYQRGGFRDAIDGIGKTVFTLSVSLASLLFGAHIASNLAPRVAALPPPGRVVRHGLTVLSVLMFAATFPAYFRLSPAFRYQATAALMFAYPGTLTRYVLSLQLNPLKSPIPLGTFTANALGTALLGAFHALQRTNSPVSVTACALLQGLSDGYCGCLTTVSTFAAEIHAMKDRKAWLYVAVSWGAGQVLLLLILRPAYWTGHVREQLACSLD